MTFDPDEGTPAQPRASWWRRVWSRMPNSRRGAPAVARGRVGTVWHWSWRIALVLLLLYYPAGALIVENIDDDPQFAPRNVVAGESRAVAMAADLVDREVNVHQWTPMQPFFTPAAILDNMPNYQRGMIAALGRFSTEMMDQLGRTRGSSQVDRDLDAARGFLNEQPNQWVWQPSDP